MYIFFPIFQYSSYLLLNIYRASVVSLPVINLNCILSKLINALIYFSSTFFTIFIACSSNFTGPAAFPGFIPLITCTISIRITFFIDPPSNNLFPFYFLHHFFLTTSVTIQPCCNFSGITFTSLKYLLCFCTIGTKSILVLLSPALNVTFLLSFL